MFVHTLGDAHLYRNHLEQADLQLSRTPYELPKLELRPDRKSLLSFRYEDIRLVDYRAHPPIRAPIHSPSRCSRSCTGR